MLASSAVFTGGYSCKMLAIPAHSHSKFVSLTVSVACPSYFLGDYRFGCSLVVMPFPLCLLFSTCKSAVIFILFVHGDSTESLFIQLFYLRLSKTAATSRSWLQKILVSLCTGHLLVANYIVGVAGTLVSVWPSYFTHYRRLLLVWLQRPPAGPLPGSGLVDVMS